MFEGRTLSQLEILTLMEMDDDGTTPRFRKGHWVDQSDWYKKLYIRPDIEWAIPDVPCIIFFHSNALKGNKEGKLYFSRLLYRHGDRISVRDLTPKEMEAQGNGGPRKWRPKEMEAKFPKGKQKGEM